MVLASTPIITQPEESPVLTTLMSLLPHLERKLRDARAWNGLRVRERSGASYCRVVCRDELVSRTSPARRYVVGLHAFTQDFAGSLHNHRFPLAVLPLDPQGQLGVDLYEMPWELREGERVIQQGSMTARSGTPWAIQRCVEVYHSVRSHRPHLSLNVSDVTNPPARENRVLVEPLPDVQTDEVRLALLGACVRKPS